MNLPINIINDILKTAAEMHGHIWYYHVSEKGQAEWKYNRKNKRIDGICELYEKKAIHKPLFQRTILKESTTKKELVEKENPEEYIYCGFSYVLGETIQNDHKRIYVYKSFENKRKKESVFLFLVYNVEGYTNEYNKLERCALYKNNKEYEILTYTLFNQLKVGNSYYHHLGLCVY